MVPTAQVTQRCALPGTSALRDRTTRTGGVPRLVHGARMIPRCARRGTPAPRERPRPPFFVSLDTIVLQDRMIHSGIRRVQSHTMCAISGTFASRDRTTRTDGGCPTLPRIRASRDSNSRGTNSRALSVPRHAPPGCIASRPQAWRSLVRKGGFARGGRPCYAPQGAGARMPAWRPRGRSARPGTSARRVPYSPRYATRDLCALLPVGWSR